MRLICNLKHLWGGPHTIGKTRVMIGPQGEVDVDDGTAAFLLRNMPQEWTTVAQAQAKPPVPALEIVGTAFDGPGAPIVEKPASLNYQPVDLLGRPKELNVPQATREAFEHAQRQAQQGQPGFAPPPPQAAPPPPPPSATAQPPAPPSPPAGAPPARPRSRLLLRPIRPGVLRRGRLRGWG